ncbi:esterase-like activity of phytase family protein [Sphingomonas sp.]|uniref:esterase-like activity of phytase family protein n=1 Tax=Sphingomonas sp. TaxID=28214 RepID=UPI002DD6B403|nr:esterase-like activity of phytase family protein [Sphingomonas sp.]
MRVLALILLILLLTPSWSGLERMPLYSGTPRVTVKPVDLVRSDPARRTIGPLTYLGGVQLSSRDPAFGGFSAMNVSGTRFRLLSDGGLTFAFTMDDDMQPSDLAFGRLPDGPGRGWEKRDRDSESMAVDPATGRVWVGFERANAVWLYTPVLDRAIRARAPVEMADWPLNGGAESMARLASGRFVILSESAWAKGGGRQALLFDRDPTDPAARSMAFRLVTPPGYRATEAVELPDGRLLVLARRASLEGGFTARLLLADISRIRPGVAIRPAELAHFAGPVIHDNFEALAVTREGGATIVWIASDDNPPSLFQRTLLLKFRLDLPAPAQSKRRPGR